MSRPFEKPPISQTDEERTMRMSRRRPHGQVKRRAPANAPGFQFQCEYGGLSLGPAATGVYIREAGSGAVRPAEGATIRSGDILFVDREAAAFSESQQSLLLQRQQYEAQVRRDRAESRNRIFSAALGLTSAVISIITVIVLSNPN